MGFPWHRDLEVSGPAGPIHGRARSIPRPGPPKPNPTQTNPSPNLNPHPPPTPQANGAASLILSLGGPAELELGAEPIAEPALAPRTDGIRYSADHRVLPDAHAAAAAGAAAAGDVAVVERLSLGHGDLLVLTGRARWELLHRVLPSRTAEERVSLVFGAW